MNRERTFILLTVALLWIGSGSAMALGYRSGDQPGSSTQVRLTKKDRQWDKHLLTINFIDKNPESEGSKIYHAIIPDPRTRRVRGRRFITPSFQTLTPISAAWPVRCSAPFISRPMTASRSARCWTMSCAGTRAYPPKTGVTALSIYSTVPTGWPSRSARVTRPGWTLRPAAYCCMS